MSSAVAYEERLCLFLDILGFKSHIDESAKEVPAKAIWRPKTVQSIHSALKAIQRAMHGPMSNIGVDVETSKQVSQFSDSIVVSYRITEPSAVFGMLYDIYLLQIDLIQRGLLVRGAITAGLLYHDENIVFGPALVEAAELEKLALYPRVILSQEIIDLGKRKKAQHHSNDDEFKSISSLIKRDLDGMFYIDYFAVSPGEFDEEWDGLLEHLISLREIIRRLSQLTKNASIKLKHSWMRQKFNDIAQPLERSKYRVFNGLSVPDELEDHIVSVSPFK